jgi:hypothetical protein
MNRYGKGMTVTITTAAATAVQRFPDLVLDVLDEALSVAGHRRVADVYGLNENVDIAAAHTSSGFRIVVVNHNARELTATVAPLGEHTSGAQEWIDTVTGKLLPSESSPGLLVLRIPASGFRCIEYRSR